MLEIDGTMTILRTKNTEGKPIGWSAAEDWKDTQDLLEQVREAEAAAGSQHLLHERVSVRSPLPTEEMSSSARLPARFAARGKAVCVAVPSGNR